MLIRKRNISFLFIITAVLLAGCSDNDFDAAAKQNSIEEVSEESVEEAGVEEIPAKVEIDDLAEAGMEENLNEFKNDESSADTKRAETFTGAATELEGEWKRYLHHHDGFLNIFEVTGDEFKFELQVYGGANTNFIEGTAQLDGNKAYYEIEDSKCGLNFEFYGDVIEIVETEECHLLGMNGTFFYGKYQKGPNQVEVDLAQLGFLNEAENELFKTIVGDAYSKFVDNMSLTYEEEDLDNLQARVISGFVRGLGGSMAGIIMLNEKYVYAAVPSVETSKTDYYTNDPAYSNQVPRTIRNWIDSNPSLLGEVNYK